MRKYVSFLLVSSLFYSCHSKKQALPEVRKPVTEKNFDYFELSYRGGWTGGLSFCVDSNRIFFFPRVLQPIDGNITKYGLLPDSIYDHINSIIPHLKTIRSLDPDSAYCDDCAKLSIKTINGSDTMRLYLAGAIDSTIWDFIGRLEKFEETGRAQQLTTAYFMLETQHHIIPMPPKIQPK